MQIKAIRRHRYITYWMINDKKTGHTQCFEDVKKPELSYICWECKMAQPLWKHLDSFNLNMYLLKDLAIPLHS